MEVIQIHTDLNYGNWQMKREFLLPVVRIFTVILMAILPDLCPHQNITLTDNYSLLVNESRTKAISKNTTTGSATRNNDSGSGGERNAPRRNDVNQMCFL